MSDERGGLNRFPAALIFDLDHTLWDFAANSRMSLIEGFGEFNLDALGIESSLIWINSFEVANNRCWALYRDGEIDKATLNSHHQWGTKHILQRLEQQHKIYCVKREVAGVMHDPDQGDTIVWKKVPPTYFTYTN